MTKLDLKSSRKEGSLPVRIFIGAWIVLLLAAAGTDSTRAQNIAESWEGIQKDAFDTDPPDSHGAPGPSGIITTVNWEISYYTKSGALIWGPTNLWGSTNAFFAANTGMNNQNADPRTVFDQDSRRFFVVMQENHASQFWLNVAVSRSSDPRTSGTNDWIFYRFDATQYSATNNAGGKNYGGDYPGMAVDSQALYVVYLMYSLLPSGNLSGSGTNALNSAVLIMNKAQLLAGTGSLVSTFTDAVTIQPATPVGASPANILYMIAMWNTNTLKLYALSNPLGARTLTTAFLTVTNSLSGPANNSPQLGSTNLIDPLQGKMQGHVTLVQGDLWCAMTAGPAAGPAQAGYWRIRLNGWPGANSPTLVEEGTLGASTDWNFLPSISANLAGDVAVTWTKSSAALYPTMMCAWRAAGSSGFAPPIVVKASGAPNNDGRWGDYASSYPDPNDGSFWVVNEWTRLDTGTWSTWWARIVTPGREFYVNKNSGNPQIQDGSVVFPFTTVGLAHAVITGGRIHIFGGHYNEKLYLSKAVTLDTYGGGGPVVLGAP